VVSQDTSPMVWYVDGHIVTLILFITTVIMGTSRLALLFEYVWPMANGVGKFQFVKVGMTVQHYCNEALNLILGTQQCTCRVCMTYLHGFEN
jgi:hypothetical protein